MSSSAFAIGALAVLSIGLLTLLVLNTALAKGSFRAHELRVQKAELAQREQLLRTQIQDASSPVTLTKRAKALGLVPATAPVFIRLEDGTIVGVSYPAGVPLDPATGEPQLSALPTGQDVAPTGQGTAATDQGPDTAASQPTPAAAPTPDSAQSTPTPGVATTTGTDTEQPLGITGR
jgi:hypothetical protein